MSLTMSLKKKNNNFEENWCFKKDAQEKKKRKTNSNIWFVNIVLQIRFADPNLLMFSKGVSLSSHIDY